MRHGATGNEGHQQKEIILPELQPHRLGHRDGQKKEAVEEHRNPQCEAAGQKGGWGTFFAHDQQGAADDPIGCATGQQTAAN